MEGLTQLCCPKFIDCVSLVALYRMVELEMLGLLVDWVDPFIDWWNWFIGLVAFP